MKKTLFFALLLIILIWCCKKTITDYIYVSVPAPYDSTNIATPPSGLADYAPYFQHIIDSCIANYVPVCYLPAGRFAMKEPLILDKKSNGTYVFFTIQLVGAGTAGESDGSGTILDWTQSPHAAFGIGIQDGKGVIVKGIKVWGAFRYNYPDSGAAQFYNSSYTSYGDGICRDTQYSPYSGVTIDPFGPSVPSDGGFPGTDAYGVPLSTYYFGGTYGSTGIHVTECYITNWVCLMITSPNGRTQNADNLTFDFLQFGNSKTNVAGCQDQEKNNTIAHVQSWGQTWMIFSTGLYGAGSIGAWNLSYFSIAGRNHDFIYNNQGGYFQTNADHIFAESLRSLGFWCSINGSTLSQSIIDFAGPDETGSYTDNQISGYGITFDGDQLRMYGWNLPITIATGAGANNMHFINTAFDGGVPIYPQNYPYGYSDFLNCLVGAQSSANVLNPIGPSVTSIYAYPTTSNVAAHNVPLDNVTHQLSSGIVVTNSTVKVGEPIVGTYDYITYKVVGVVSAITSNGFTLTYMPVDNDPTKSYSLNHWVTLYK
jgi:hypothetical protein